MNELEKRFFDELTKDRSESANVLEKPSLSGVQHSVVEKYSDQAHFIYELLQNADDANATDARFYLYQDKLVFIHNGLRHFNITDPKNEKEDAENGTLGDLNAITSVANSAKEGNKATIGKFGVGFKAVFQYTETPHIYDPNVSFKIERFIVPKPIDGDYPGRKGDETVFVFPFDHKKRSANEAFEDISDKLRHLVYPNLFLNHLIDISFEIDNSNTLGFYEKKCLQERHFDDINAKLFELTFKEGNNPVSENLWLFSRKDEHGRDYCVGFFVDDEYKIKAVNMPAFCYFPTKEDTKLHFIIHAPFLLTDSREGIKAGEAHNKNMISLLAELSADALSCLRAIGEEKGEQLIDDSILDVIPIYEKVFSPLNDKSRISFLPFYYELKDALMDGLLPTKDGYTSHENAYWSHTKDINLLFSDEQLCQLLKKEDVHWVFCSRPRHALDAYGKTVVKDYIDDLVYDWFNDDDIFRLINKGFIEKQSFEWLNRFYKWIMDTPRRFEKLVSAPIFIDNKGKAVAAYDKEKQKTLFLPSSAVKDCPTVHSEFLMNPDTKKFLLDVVKLEEPSLQDYIYSTVIPNIKNDEAIDSFEYFKIFFSYYKQCRATEIDDYIEKIKDLSFLVYYDSEEEEYYRTVARELYYPEKDLLEFFAPKTDTKFLELEMYLEEFPDKDNLRLFFNELGIMHLPKVEKHELTWSEVYRESDLPEEHSTAGHHYTETRIDGCLELATYIENNMVAEKSFVLWNMIIRLINEGNDISPTGDYRYFYFFNHHKAYRSVFAKMLQEKKWLVDKNGSFVCPNETRITDLSEEYDTESEGAQKLIAFLELSDKKDGELTEDQKFVKMCKKYGIENEEDLQKFYEWKKKQQTEPKTAPSGEDISNSKEKNTLVTIVKEIEERAKKKHAGGEPLPVDPFDNPDEKPEETDRDDYIPGVIDYASKIEKEKEKQASEIQEITIMQELQETALSAKQYSYLWFKTLLDMEILNSDVDSLNSREVNISFGKIEKEEGTQKTYVLMHPSKYIPQYMEDLTDIPLTLHMKDGSSKSVAIEVSSVQSYSLHVKLKDASGLSGVKLSEVQEITIKASRPVFLLQALKEKISALKDSNGEPLADEYSMKENLPGNLEFVFGPPGTGKTTYLANQFIIPLMKQKENARVLVLTPTNKAADVITSRIMESMGEDESYKQWLIRFGITGDERIENSEVFREKTFDLRNLQRSVTVTTIARFAYDFFMPVGERLYLDALNWDYIVIDEASMIPLVQIIYPIFRKTPKKFLIAGDPFQIEPITTVELWADENIYKLVNLKSFVDSSTEPYNYPVVKLTTQYRSIPEIGSVFSDFTYGGILEHYRESASRRNLNLEGIIDVDSLNVLKFPVSKYESIYRSKRLNGTTPYQTYSAIFTMEFSSFFAKALEIRNPGEKFTIGIVAPYKAQASLIDRLMSSAEIPYDVKIQVGTIHGFQGDECDVVIVVLNTPPLITSSPNLFLNKQNVLNVAISRAKDYLFVIMPDNKTENISRLQKVKRIEDLMRHSGHFTEKTTGEIEKTMFDDDRFIENNSFATSHQTVNVYGQPEKRYEIRSEDNAVDVQIHRPKNVPQFVFDILPKKEPVRPLEQTYSSAKRLGIKLDDLKIGSKVEHESFKTGKVVEINKENNLILVKFEAGEKKFVFPDAFQKGFLKLL